MCMSRKRHNLVAWRNPNETFLHFEIPFSQLTSEESAEDCFYCCFQSRYSLGAQHVSVGQSEGFWPFCGCEQGWWGVWAGGGGPHQVIGNLIAIGNRQYRHKEYFLKWCWLVINCLCPQDSAEEWKEDTDYCPGMGPRPRYQTYTMMNNSSFCF